MTLTLALMVASLLHADDGAPQPDGDLPGAIEHLEPANDVRRHAVWIQPAAVLLPIITTAANVGTYVALPLGASLSLESLQLNLEATFYMYRSTGSAFTGGYFSLGPLFHTGDAPLGGFFLSPKLGFDVMHEFSRGGTSAAFMAGLDAGWQRCFGPVYLAFLLGISAGWSLSDGDWIQGPGLNGPIGFSTPKSRPVVGININLMRLGIAL
jgi:hypothetical protein